jgi:hypothetical protein
MALVRSVCRPTISVLNSRVKPRFDARFLRGRADLPHCSPENELPPKLQ